jgi:hypothetical protein
MQIFNLIEALITIMAFFTLGKYSKFPFLQFQGEKVAG